MLRSCRDPYVYSDDVTFYVTNNIILPLFVGVGVIGNVFTLSTLTNSAFRTRNAAFVYLTALSINDLLRLVLAMPDCIREIGVLRRDIAFSLQYTQISIICGSISFIFRHSSAWIVMSAVLVRYVSISWKYRPTRWVRLSTNRVIVFLIYLAVLVIDFPHFLEYEPSLISGQCYNDTLYQAVATEFGQRESYNTIYPWVSGSLCFLLPFALTMLFLLFHMIRTGIFRKCTCRNISERNRVDDGSSVGYSDHHHRGRGAAVGDELQIEVLISVLVMVFLLLELPLAVYTMYTDLRPAMNDAVPMLQWIFITLSYMRCSFYFFIYMVVSSDFRRTFRRTCCCCTLSADGEDDEFYEPLDCAVFCLCSEIEENDERSQSKREKARKKKKKQEALWI